MARERRTFTTDFKKQMVTLYKNGKSKQDIIREYDLSAHSDAIANFKDRA